MGAGLPALQTDPVRPALTPRQGEATSRSGQTSGRWLDGAVGTAGSRQSRLRAPAEGVCREAWGGKAGWVAGLLSSVHWTGPGAVGIKAPSLEPNFCGWAPEVFPNHR